MTSLPAGWAEPRPQAAAAATPAPAAAPADALAGRVLASGALTAALVALALGQWAAWVPHYLTWPWWSDHDVFATLAHGWDLGLRPYRDLAANNFPGTIYIAWALGKGAGWGAPWALAALDAGLLIVLGATLCAWSRRRFGTALPGAIAAAAFLSQYLGLDYTQTAQRDWHGPLFTVLALLVAESGRGRSAWIAAGLLAAAGASIRPQTVLLWPALASALWTENQSPESFAPRRALASSLAALAVGLALALAPLAAAGLVGDFLTSVRTAAVGGSYNRLTPASFLVELARQANVRDLAVAAALALMLGRGDGPARRSARTWLVALAGVWLYRPLSPCPHAYLDQPRWLVGAVALGVLAALALADRAAAAGPRLAMVLALVAVGVQVRPALVVPSQVLPALRGLAAGTWSEPEACPPGYRSNPGVYLAARYAWDDYRGVLTHLRAHTAPDTAVANLLGAAPALTGPTGRRSALPAESLAWLLVRPEATAQFVAALAAAGPDTVVVWAPGELDRPDGPPDVHAALQALAPIVRRNFRPEATFGALEVWRHRDAAAADRPGPAGGAGAARD